MSIPKYGRIPSARTLLTFCDSWPRHSCALTPICPYSVIAHCRVSMLQPKATSEIQNGPKSGVQGATILGTLQVQLSRHLLFLKLG